MRETLETASYGNGTYKFRVDDTDIDPNATAYTYTVRADNGSTRTSDFYTFTVKMVLSDVGANTLFTMPQVSYSLVNNTTPTLSFSAPNWAAKGYPTVYKFYRNNTQIGSFSGTGNHSFSDTPTADGVYTYRVDEEVAGVTIRGRDFTFTRDTSPVDPSTFPAKPDAPTLVGRIDGAGAVTLSWMPAATGGEVRS